jgi:hypothetical protein
VIKHMPSKLKVLSLIPSTTKKKFFTSVLEIEPYALYVLGKCSTTELHPHFMYFLYNNQYRIFKPFEITIIYYNI